MRALAIVLLSLAVGGCGLARLHEKPKDDRRTEDSFASCEVAPGEYDADCAVSRMVWSAVTGAP